MNCFKSQVDRDELLKDQHKLEEQYNALVGQRGTKPERRKLFRQMNQLRDEYSDRLPLQTLAICPFCGEAFKIPMDPFGYDGPWWRSRPLIDHSCPHFVVLREAINLNGLRADLGDIGEIDFGPEVPYVIKRLFKIPTMTCVMSRVDLVCGYTYYPMVYFAESPPPKDEVKCGTWASPYAGFFEEVQDSWLFDFGPFVESGQVRLANIRGDEVTLESHDLDSFPLLNLPGHQGLQNARRSDIKQYPAPKSKHSHYQGPDE